MSFLDGQVLSFGKRLSALVPFRKKEEALEYFFALNIGSEKLTAALWTIEGKQLKFLETSSDSYSSLDNLSSLTDKLLDTVLGIRDIDPQKILFGVPGTWLSDENLKEEYLKILRSLVKELELVPMAYVETAHALVHWLEKTDGVPPTVILVGFEPLHLTVTVVRAGKLDGVKTILRGDSSGADIEKALLTFTSVETLPSKFLIYGHDVSGLKSQLLNFAWMSKLSFLHFPKIENLSDDMEIKSVCLAGASEIESDVYVKEGTSEQVVERSAIVSAKDTPKVEEENLGFVVGDVSKGESEEKELVIPEDTSLVMENFEQEIAIPPPVQVQEKGARKFSFLLGIIGIVVIILAAYLFLPKAEVKIFVEPKIVEKDTQVTADPNQKGVDEDAKIIPGQVVDTDVSGSLKDNASGKKQIGDPAKGTVIIYNKTNESKTISKGTSLTLSNGPKFTLDISVNIASQSAADSGITYGKVNATVTASAVGADGNLPSGSELTAGNLSSSQVSAKAEGNFSGGTSKEVTVVSSDDQKRLLASLTSNLRKQAQTKLQEKLSQKKILEEALNEEIVKKTFSKNINDQASEFSLNLTVKYKGTAFEDKDLKLIVSKLIDTQVPEGFKLNLEDTETQADVSKLEKDGRLIFLARFKAKLMPKIDTDKVRNQIKGKTPSEVENILKGMENILGSEIKFSPSLPPFLQRLPIFGRNIKIEVGLK